ncbi:MAG: DJ-1/PfpI family protein [Bacteroidales bacterium]|jgi:4-methyl-5(b-hydroxyethyl)-thiazole monophosphate biosynthesis|nr:DJ-1/PfpI family protein [Bacteroidales bacterium]
MKKVLLLLANGFEPFEASAFIDVFGWNLVEGDKSTTLSSCALTKEVNSSFGQKLIAEFTIDEINTKDFDALAIPGGFEQYGFYKDAYDERFLNLIREFRNQNKPIASICVAALSLGKSGILKGKNATTYPNPVRINTLKDYGVNIQENILVVDENIITSCGPSTAIDVAFTLLQILTSEKNENRVRQLMGFEKWNKKFGDVADVHI